MLGRADVKFIRMALLSQIYKVEGEPTTIDELADRLECGYCTVLRHREALQKQGLINIQTRKGRDTGGSIYLVTDKGTKFIKDDSAW